MKKSLIPPNIQILIYPSIILTALAILSFVVINFGLAQISKQSQAVSEAKVNEKILAEKEATLTEVSATVAKEAASVSLALPEENPALAILSQLKLLALSKTIVLSNIKVGVGSQEENLLRVNISFNANGQDINVLDFLSSIKNISPITTIEKIKMSQVSGVLSADTNVRGYWSLLPKTLPKVTEPVTNLSEPERNLLEKVMALTPPSFTQVTPSAPSIRDNPF
ncbi:hypothetical protein A2210_00985 [Candidatus Woesebacteria bacterium RIFOXYA1_FULL_40_18]|uniref:Uncharacterized protein n=2 Tax=Candidatus Woeseibacteriota TaxID=1752722 RepID=A0A1F8CIK3_9BACT|nr:MAG: hypothetical protein A2210_00985 [Candidatus Woesebacteria bacterium RIFOXYA1_FULL_40_18]OGM81558.1 MAG: hypothetical protein A2361_00760 [Candidatus Woesebacteria bacterium RIFOXYB1_FULL_40_26]